MIDPTTQKLFMLRNDDDEIKRRVGVDIPVPTRYRWATKGVLNHITGKREKLEVVRIGGKVYTTCEAIIEFWERLSLAPKSTSRTFTQRKREVEAASANLDAAGIK